eukprot:TRINITY_DN5777_c0_g1_i1.p2 TRINITY_DN5777_c0_g1~~TRINITY_DN5777_c0_g1_i1.p2  ORF type:complete len:313 (+),score=84.26 TRINITY_DN5777_c0_g1_i1:1305-2243(+)
MQRSKDPVNELSKLLLGGWTMLQDSCPDENCNVPLMEDKKQKRILCVSCNRYYTRETSSTGDVSLKLVNNNNSTQNTTTNTNTSTNTSVNTNTNASENVNTTPKKIKVEHNEEDSRESDTKKYDEMSKRTNLVSARIGEKLLQGWGLMGDVCPKPGCDTPLMRDRQKKLYCVACETHIITKEEFDPTKHKLVQNSPTKNETGESFLSSSFESVQATHANQTFPSSTTTPRLERHLYSPQPERTPATTNIQHPSISMNSALDSSVSVLYRTLEKTTNLLEKSSSIEESTKICFLIKECANAIQALQSIQPFRL